MYVTYQSLCKSGRCLKLKTKFFVLIGFFFFRHALLTPYFLEKNYTIFEAVHSSTEVDRHPTNEKPSWWTKKYPHHHF